MRYLFVLLGAAGLLLGALGAAAQGLAGPASFVALPVRGAWGRHPTFGPFRGRGVWRPSFSESSEVGLAGLALAYNTSSHQRLRFEVADALHQQQARVEARADLRLRGNLLDNVRDVLGTAKAVFGPGPDSVAGRRPPVDLFAGVINVQGQPAGAYWEFGVENSRQLGGQPLRGELHDAHQRITFEATGNAVAYAQAGGPEAALLAARVPHGFLFRLDGQAIAALDLGLGASQLLGLPPVVFWLKTDLDPTLQLVVASMATALLARSGSR